MREQGFVGCNVTIPHKEAAFAAAAETRPAARAAGAANTLWFEGGKLIADNTDSAGFVDSLIAALPALQLTAYVCVLGAGGAARGIVFALLRARRGRGAHLQSHAQRADAGCCLFRRKGKAHDWRERVDRSRDARCWSIQHPSACRAQMHSTWMLRRSILGCVVADIVYVPLETPLLAAARARGLATVDGLGMLLHQAVPGFEKWFGVRPEVTAELRALIERDIEGA